MHCSPQGVSIRHPQQSSTCKTSRTGWASYHMSQVEAGKTAHQAANSMLAASTVQQKAELKERFRPAGQRAKHLWPAQPTTMELSEYPLKSCRGQQTSACLPSVTGQAEHAMAAEG